MVVLYCCLLYKDFDMFQAHCKERKVVYNQGFLRRFRDPIRVPRISENYHRVPKIRENSVPIIREIWSLQIQTGFLTFSLKKLCYNIYTL